MAASGQDAPRGVDNELGGFRLFPAARQPHSLSALQSHGSPAFRVSGSLCLSSPQPSPCSLIAFAKRHPLVANGWAFAGRPSSGKRARIRCRTKAA